MAAELRSALPRAEVIELGDDDVADVIRTAVSRAEVLGVAGGDGTISAAATAAMTAGLPLLVVPAGTFNHFAKELDLSAPVDAVDAVRAGHAVCIDVGIVNGDVFLNTASLGSYPEFVKIRERWEPRLGKPVAAAVALVHVFRKCPPLAAEVDGVPRRLLMLFYRQRCLPAAQIRSSVEVSPRHWSAPREAGRLGYARLRLALGGGRSDR